MLFCLPDLISKFQRVVVEEYFFLNLSQFIHVHKFPSFSMLNCGCVSLEQEGASFLVDLLCLGTS